MSFTNCMVNRGILGNGSFLSCEWNFFHNLSKKKEREREETASIKSLKVWSTFSITASLSFTLEPKIMGGISWPNGITAICQSTAIVTGSRKKKKKSKRENDLLQTYQLQNPCTVLAKESKFWTIKWHHMQTVPG